MFRTKGIVLKKVHKFVSYAVGKGVKWDVSPCISWLVYGKLADVQPDSFIHFPTS